MMRVIELKESITASNDRDADALREEMRIEGTLLVNLMSSPGSGKTTLLSRIIEDLGGEWKIAVLRRRGQGRFRCTRTGCATWMRG